VDPKTGRLVVDAVTLADAGLYTCTARNVLGEEAVARVLVYVGGFFIVFMKF
jgi:hypothetical protein